MATSASAAAPTDARDQLTPAQRMAQMHEDHHATVEDAPDEDLNPTSANGASSWGPTMSAKAAGKQKAQDTSVKLDTQSQEMFPELGGPKKTTNNVAPVWGGKTNTNGKANGLNTTNGSSRASTPVSGNATPNRPPSMAIPGRNVEHMILEPHHILPRAQLRRPIADIMKDINRGSRATLTMTPGAGGKMRFDAQGPSKEAWQALKDLVQQIGTKVGDLNCRIAPQISLTPHRSKRLRYPFRSPPEPILLGREVL